MRKSKVWSVVKAGSNTTGVLFSLCLAKYNIACDVDKILKLEPKMICRDWLGE